jgi:hypothetical protein
MPETTHLLASTKKAVPSHRTPKPDFARRQTWSAAKPPVQDRWGLAGVTDARWPASNGQPLARGAGRRLPIGAWIKARKNY